MPDVAGFLKKAFPFISAAASFGGPLGTLAAGMVGKALGVDKLGPTQDAISAAIAGSTPEQLNQMKQIEADLQIKMQQMGFQHAEELERLGVDDRVSARNLQIATKSWTVPAMAWLIVLSFSFVVVAILRGWGKVEEAFAGTLIGYLAANCNQVVSYFFGSSAGNDRQTELKAGK